MNSYLDLATGRLAFKTFESGKESEWVTLLNGYGRPKEDFNSFAKFLEQSGYNVLSPDNRGAGESTSKLTVWTFDQYCEDVALIWQNLEIGKTHVLGISMGGMIAQGLCLSSPASLLSCHLVSTSTSFSNLTTSNTPWGATLAEVLDQLRVYVAEDFFFKNKILLTAMAKQILKGTENQPSAASSRIDFAGQRNAIKGFSLSRAEIQKNLVPLFTYHGAEDRVIPAESIKGVEAAPNFKSATLYPGVGHLLLAECPKLLFQDVLKNLESV